MKKLEKHPEWQDLIAEYVREYGQVDGCVDVIPQGISQKTIERAVSPNDRYYVPEFAKKVEKAREEYHLMHTPLSKDAEFVRDVRQQVKTMAKAGRSSTTKYEYDPETGKQKTRVLQQPGIDQWLYHVAYPKQEFTEEAILVVVPNQLEFFAQQDDVSSEELIRLQRLILRFKTAACEELQKRGLSTRKLVYDQQ